MLPDQATRLLTRALGRVLGTATQASVSYLRCLPPEVCRALAADPFFLVPGWRIAVVTDQIDIDRRCITADLAVAWREEKGEATLLLVDPSSAGAGMDGIYSAGREISEKVLFDAARASAREDVQRGYKTHVDKAMVKARQLSGQRHLAPWREFVYLCRVVTDPRQAGLALHELGLWPVAFSGRPDDEDLDKAARLTERLLPTQGARWSPEQRVAALRLDATQAETEKTLVRYLREVQSLSRIEAMARLAPLDDLQLNRMRPRLFVDSELAAVEWVSWRARNRKPYKWSGLSLNDDDRLELLLQTENESAASGARLEVRWQVVPEDLPKGSVDYVIEIRTDHDVLAEKRVTHSGKTPQKVVFTQDDFAAVESDACFEPQVVIRVLGDRPQQIVSPEDFILRFGRSDQPVKASAGKTFETLALAVAHVAPNADVFKTMAREPGNPALFSEDARGYISCRWEGKSGKVYSPPLIRRLARDWIERGGPIGRWRLSVRADGTPIGTETFVSIDAETDVSALTLASRRLAHWMSKAHGPIGVLYDDDAVPGLSEYVNAARQTWKTGTPELTLMHTLEVVSATGTTLGLIVLPTHPLRVAWQQSFDAMVRHHRYAEGLPAAKIERLLAPVTGAHYPAFLPGLEVGQGFVFADVLGFHAVALAAANDPEPKATVALLGRLVGGDESIAPTVGRAAAQALGAEVGRYLRLHPSYRRIRLHALQVGDAMPVARALSHALQEVQIEDVDSDEAWPVCFELDLYGGPGTGRFLAKLNERSRTGAAGITEVDRRLLDSVHRPGGVRLPRLQWARRSAERPSTAAHMCLAFDLFKARLETRPRASLPPTGVLEAHGLMLMPTREFNATAQQPRWMSYIPAKPEGEKHPVTRVLTERQVLLHNAVLQAVARQLGGTVDDWPVLVTDADAVHAGLLEEMHHLCDWVVTADRNAGIEYFDSPLELPRVYEAYIIDCVPERDDLGFTQLITSTSRLDEIQRLLGRVLQEMGLQPTAQACRFVLDGLKSISGRLALRLAGDGRTVEEMVALALTRHRLALDGTGLSLQDGFLIPLDDVPELFSDVGTPANRSRRADLLHVTAARRGGLKLTFIEVKYRRRLEAAQSDELADEIESQLDASCRHWERLFGMATSMLEKTVHRAWLARVLRFYARKGRRHGLRDPAWQVIDREIDRMVKKESDPPALSDLERRAYIFCPELNDGQTLGVDHGGGAQIQIFGRSIDAAALVTLEACAPSTVRPRTMGDPAMVESDGASRTSACEVAIESMDDELAPPSNEATTTPVWASTMDSDPTESLASLRPAPIAESTNPPRADIVLGHRQTDASELTWLPSIRSNPHLMILGLPGMGKTTCLINLCIQLQEHQITPIVFSYHEDIDEKLAERINSGLLEVKFNGLGFNPMRVDQDTPHAFVDNVTTLRDIFSTIFPDLGDVQLGRLREALKASYQACGWAIGQRGKTPPFRAFYDLLKADPKPERGLLTRLSELDDYGFFDRVEGAQSLLDQRRCALVQIHGTQNEVLQRAFSTFVLHNIYQNMFRRGLQSEITHAIVFDEAHLAAGLKLLPTMAKECRKYGIAFVVASQEAKDFDPSLYSAIANYLTLRLNETDARQMARIFTTSERVKDCADDIKRMAKYHAMYNGEGSRRPVVIRLLA